MILKRLYELAEREGLLQDPAFDVAPVACLIQIGEMGEFRGMVNLRNLIPSDTKKAKAKPKLDKGKPMPVPVRPVVLEIQKPDKNQTEPPASRWKTTDPAASGQEKPAAFLADIIARVLPVQRLIDDKDRAKFDAQRSTFWRFIDHVANSTNDAAMRALQRFGEWLKTDASAAETLAGAVETKDFALAQLCTFAWLPDENIGQPILARVAVRDWWRQFFTADRVAQETDTFRSLCQVTEKETAIPSSIKTRINGLVSIGCRADAYLVTAVDASESYGLSGAATGMVSAQGVDGFTRALNALIASDLPRRPKTSLRIGTTMFLFWTRYNEPHHVMLFESPEPDEVARLIQSVELGRPHYGTDERNFYCLTISGNSARVVVRDYLEEPLPKVEVNLGRWFQDLEIIDAFSGEKTACFPLWRIANTTVRSGDNLPPDTPSVLLSAALKGAAVPQHILAASLRRIRVERGRDQFRSERMALIKLTLNRSLSKGEMAMSVELDRQRTADPAYVCGRLLACLAYIQAFERDPKQHGFGQDAAMLSGYYGAASAAPRSVFGTLLRQTQHRLSKLGGEYGSFVTKRVKEIEEFTQHLGSVDRWDGDFPAVLSLPEQGRFALGFYHQRSEYRAARRSGKRHTHTKSC